MKENQPTLEISLINKLHNSEVIPNKLTIEETP